MKQIIFTCWITVISLTGCTQTSSQKTTSVKTKTMSKVGGPCEGCEAVHESPVPFGQLSWVDTLPDFQENGPKIEVSGVVYHNDSRTPAKDVVIYVYHTDQSGRYPKKGTEKGWAMRHGYIRGWMKTNKDGRYKFYTLRPASYPNSNIPQHIHVTIKEPDKNEYWIDDYLFADDPYLVNETQTRPPRGGRGVLQLKPNKGLLVATRHIILGLNVPDYPATASNKNLQSGLAIGTNCPAFDPVHLSGADAGKNACPMCKYGYGQGIMVWFNHTNLDGLKEFTRKLEGEMQQRGERAFRVFLVYMNPKYKVVDDVEAKILQRKIKEWCDQQALKKVAVVWIPSPVDPETAQLYKINPEANNTVFLYKKRKVAAKWVNMEYNDQSLNTILGKL